jgi:uncharacterized SAM-binding protein YcdF (DUF218 family)
MALVLITGVVAKRVLHFSVPPSLKNQVQQYLTIPDQLPSEKADILYVLGGSTRSTWRHIRRAAELYHQKKVERILVISSDEKCWYDTSLKRNLIRNEWTAKMFVRRDVPDSVIQFMPFKKGKFGTLSESRTVAGYLKDKKYTSVILVSSPCHTRRVYESFGKSLGKVGIQMYIAGSEDPFGFSEMLLELVKIQVYSLILSSKIK